jgi:hypothetical protein
VAHVILFLESDVDNSVRDILSDSVKELGFADNDLQFGVEVHLVSAIFAGACAYEDSFRQHFNC